MKRSTIILIIFLFVLYLFSEFSYYFESEDFNLNPFDYARITDIDYTAMVVDEPDSNGKIVVTERITYDIHAASRNNLFLLLWRDLPESYVDGVKVDYKVNSVKQILDDGTEIVYEESPKLYWDDSDYVGTSGKYGPGKWYHSEGPYNEYARQYECVFFYVDGLYRENVTFEIEYEMNNAALRYGDCSELYLSFYSEDTVKHLNSFKGQVLIPDKDMPRVGNYEAHTYGTNSIEFPFTESDTIHPGYHTFSFDLDESELKFKPYNQYLEFSLISYGIDSHIFTDYASHNYYYNDDVLIELQQEQLAYEREFEEYARIKIFVLIVCIIIAILIISYVVKKNKKIKEKYIFYEPTIPVDYFREIPSDLDPVFAVNLVFCKHKNHSKKKDADGYSSIMLSLVRKGYIELEKINPMKDWVYNNVKIIVKHKPTPIAEDLLKPYILENNAAKSSNQNSDIDINNGLNPNSKVESELEFANNIADSTSNNKKLEPLTVNEESYFNLIVRHSHGNEISMYDFQSKISSDYLNTNSFVKSVENSIVNIGISQGYFQKADYEEPKKQTKSISNMFIILGILLITVVNFFSHYTYLDLAFGGFTILGITFIASAIYLRKLSRKYVLLTQFGEDEYAKWRGLYNFLNSETLMKERTVVELPLWEHYLVYATAFGISEKVIKALKIRCPDIEMSPMLSNPYYYSRNFYYSARTFRYSVHRASTFARTGGYGSFSGRTRWLRRRRSWWRWWPEAVIRSKQ